MAASTVEVPVFIDTNLGTRIAMAIPPDITAGDFKILYNANHWCHLSRVKRKSFFYHLPESMPMKYAFQGKKGTWFLHVEARALSDLSMAGLPKGVAPKVVEHVLRDGNKDTVCLEPQNFVTSTGKTDTRGEGKKRSSERSNCLKPFLQELRSTVSLPKEKANKRLKKHHRLECTASEIKKGCNGRNEETPGVTTKERSDICASANEVEPREGLSSSAIVEAPSDMSSEVVSVTAIIKRYFPICNEMEEQLKTKTDDKCSSIQVDALPGFTVKTPPRMLPSPLQTARTPDCLGGFWEASKDLQFLIADSKMENLLADWDSYALECNAHTEEATLQQPPPRGWVKQQWNTLRNKLRSNGTCDLGWPTVFDGDILGEDVDTTVFFHVCIAGDARHR
uniref:Uncharacterized protein n=1 Tax=Fagus sylvatica TaxID=28930 RepID=A0A2N9HHG9_FAGSY